MTAITYACNSWSDFLSGRRCALHSSKHDRRFMRFHVSPFTAPYVRVCFRKIPTKFRRCVRVRHDWWVTYAPRTSKKDTRLAHFIFVHWVASGHLPLYFFSTMSTPSNRILCCDRRVVNASVLNASWRSGSSLMVCNIGLSCRVSLAIPASFAFLTVVGLVLLPLRFAISHPFRFQRHA